MQTFGDYQTVSLVQPTTYQQPKTDAAGNPCQGRGGQPGHGDRAADGAGRSPSARPPRRSPSSSWAPTAAASSTPTRPIRWRTRRRSATSWRCLPILLIPAALCYTFGKMVGDTRQGWAHPGRHDHRAAGGRARRLCRRSRPATRRLAALGVDQTASALQPGGNMEGKEVRFGIANSAILGHGNDGGLQRRRSNSMHDSYTPLGGLVPLVMMQLGEVVFGGVGSGLYGMLVFVIVAVFVAGLMVGRTPEYLGKKIEVYEMKMAALLILIMPITVLGLTALAVVTGPGKAGPLNPGPARLQRDPVRLHLAGQQQRQRLRRADRQHGVLQHRPAGWPC